MSGRVAGKAAPKSSLRRAGLATATGLAVAALGGVAAASTPPSATSPKIFACYSEKTNELFHAGGTTCPIGDRSVSWTTAGPQGARGSQGPRGVQGAHGAQGPRGVQGSQGTAGGHGSRGGQGPPGGIGPQGNQGSQGARGLQGTQGSQGAGGAQGSQGARGPQGSQGPSTVSQPHPLSATAGAVTLGASWQDVVVLNSSQLDVPSGVYFGQVDVATTAEGAALCRIVRSHQTTFSDSGTIVHGHSPSSTGFGVEAQFHRTTSAKAAMQLQAFISFRSSTSNVAVECREYSGTAVAVTHAQLLAREAALPLLPSARSPSNRFHRPS